MDGHGDLDRVYEGFMKTRKAQLIYTASRTRGHLITPDPIVQYNYIHELMRSLSNSVPPDISTVDGGIASVKLHVLRSVQSTGNGVEISEDADYLAKRIGDLLDWPLVVDGCRGELGIDLRDGFTDNMKALSRMVEERYGSCRERTKRAGNELAAAEQKLVAFRAVDSAKNSVAGLAIRRTRDRIVRLEAQLRLVRSELESLREMRDESLRRNRLEVERLAQRLGGTMRAVTTRKFLDRLAKLIVELETGRQHIMAVLHRLDQPSPSVPILGELNTTDLKSIKDELDTLFTFGASVANTVPALPRYEFPDHQSSVDRRTVLGLYNYCGFLAQGMNEIYGDLFMQSNYLDGVLAIAPLEHMTEERTLNFMTQVEALTDTDGEKRRMINQVIQSILLELTQLERNIVDYYAEPNGKRAAMVESIEAERDELRRLRQESRENHATLLRLQSALEEVLAKRRYTPDTSSGGDDSREELVGEFRTVFNSIVTHLIETAKEYVGFFQSVAELYPHQNKPRRGGNEEQANEYVSLPALRDFTKTVSRVLDTADRVFGHGTSPRPSNELQRAIDKEISKHRFYFPAAT